MWIAAIIVDVNKADYVFGLKDNQKTFHDEFLELFDHAIDAYPDRFMTSLRCEAKQGSPSPRAVQTVTWVASRIVKIVHRCHHCASSTANDGQY